jgi:uncharacterized repeat protein (TIGR01451 family)
MKRLLVRLFTLTGVVVVGMIAIAHAQRTVQPVAAKVKTPPVVRPAATNGTSAVGGPVAGDSGNVAKFASGQNPRSRYPNYRGATDLNRVKLAQHVEDPDQVEPIPAGDDEFPTADEAFGHLDGGLDEDDPATADHDPEAPRELGVTGPALQARKTAGEQADRSSSPAGSNRYKPGSTGKGPARAAGGQSHNTTKAGGAGRTTEPAAAGPDPFAADRSQRYSKPVAERQESEYQEPAFIAASEMGAEFEATDLGETRIGAGPDGQKPARLRDFEPPTTIGRRADQGVASGSGLPGASQLEGLQTPSLTIEKTAPAEIQVGIAAVFQVRIRNTGSITAEHVEVIDEVPQGARLLSTRPEASPGAGSQLVWTLGSIKPGEEVAVEMELMPLSEGEIGSVATVGFSAQASARTVCTRPQLAVEVTGPREVLIGEELTLAIKVSNPGSGTARGVVLSESIPEALEHPAGSELEYEIGDLEPNETQELSLTMKATAAGHVVNLLLARGEGQVEAVGQADFEVVAPALEVSVDGPKRRYLERQATYTVMVSNPGTAAAKEVELVTHLPRGLKFVEANNSGQYDPQTNSVHWLLEELPPQEIGKVTVTTLPIEAGEQTVRVEGTAQRGLAAEKEEVILIEGVAAILFQVVDVADPIEVGGETTYEIRVVNQGSKAANNVEIVALLPAEMKPVGAEGPTRHELDGQQVRFAPLERLAPKADTTYRVRVQGLEPGDMRVRVQLLTDEIRTPVTKEESTRFYADE